MPPSISKEEALRRIDLVLSDVNKRTKSVKRNGITFSYASGSEAIRIETELKLTLVETLRQLSPTDSSYWEFVNSLEAPLNVLNIDRMVGALRSLRDKYANDFLKGFNEMIDAELFSDILEQAKSLLSQNSVRWAAVVAGVALESHLRKLTVKNSIPITKEDGSYIKAETLNSNLYTKKIIDKISLQKITSALGVRNTAAHPYKDENVNEVNKIDVESMILDIKNLLDKYPA